MDFHQFLQSLDSKTKDIIFETCESGRFATLDFVISVICVRYNVRTLHDLKIDNISIVPNLYWLQQVNLMIDSFIDMYMNSRTIVTVSDLEIELCNYLLTRRVSPLKHTTDENEVIVDGEFAVYGLGNITNHPRISLGSYPPIQLTRSIIQSDLIDYILHACHGLSFQNADGEFAGHLCMKYDVEHIQCLGILKLTGIKELALAFLHIANGNERFKASFTACVRERLTGLQHCDDHADEEEVEVQRPVVQSHQPKYSLGLPGNNSSIAGVLNYCSNSLGDSQYAPSFTKVRSLLAKRFEEVVLSRSSSNIHSAKKKESRNKKKRKQYLEYDDMGTYAALPSSYETKVEEEAADPADADRSVLLDCVAEYAMLHLGGYKYLHKRLKPYVEAEEETVDGQEAEETEEGNEGDEAAVQHDARQADGGTDEAEVAVDVEEGNVVEEAQTDGAALNIVDEEEPSSVQGHFAEDGGSEASAPTNVYGETAHVPLVANEVPLRDRYEGRMFMTPSASASSEHMEVVEAAQLKPLFLHLGALDLSDTREVGRWGELLVYQHLLTRCPLGTRVQWVNEDAESKASYDFIVSYPAKKNLGKFGTVYVEVKTTRFSDLNVFELSLWEWNFATLEPRMPYHIYRVFNAGDKNKVRIVVIKDILALLQERRIKLCIAL